MNYNNIKLILFATAILVQPKTQSQPVDSALAFFPMNVGNVWLFDRQDLHTGSHILYMRLSIIGDTILPSGIKHFIFLQQSTFDTTTLLLFRRIDSAAGNIYQCFSGSDQDRLTYSLRSRPGDTVGTIQCVFSGPDTVLGLATTAKWFRQGQSASYILAYGIGLQTQFDGDMGTWFYKSQLIYARIDGKEYGSQTSVPSTSIQPRQFQLYQNFPNPFNPSTTIRFSLAKPGYVMLKVFNILGQELRTILMQHKAAGDHQVLFNAEELPSGFYFYSLIFDDGSVTKTMLLTK